MFSFDGKMPFTLIVRTFNHFMSLESEKASIGEKIILNHNSNICENGMLTK